MQGRAGQFGTRRGRWCPAWWWSIVQREQKGGGRGDARGDGEVEGEGVGEGR